MGILTYKIRSGKVEGLVQSFTAHKGTTKNIALFKLGKKQIKLILNKPIAIKENDRVLVTGRASLDGCFKAFAYKNLDNGVLAKTSLFLLPGLKLFYLVVALIFLNLFIRGNANFITQALYFILGLFALIVIRQFLSVFRLAIKRTVEVVETPTDLKRPNYY